MLYAERLRERPWVAQGIPETFGHPWWLFWAAARIEGESLAAPELEQRRRAFGK